MSIRILVVDDDAPIRQHLRFLLQSHSDWEVCGEAENGVDAIEKHSSLNQTLSLSMFQCQ